MHTKKRGPRVFREAPRPLALCRHAPPAYLLKFPLKATSTAPKMQEIRISLCQGTALQAAEKLGGNQVL
jgi:hypothetical protein